MNSSTLQPLLHDLWSERTAYPMWLVRDLASSPTCFHCPVFGSLVKHGTHGTTPSSFGCYLLSESGRYLTPQRGLSGYIDL